MKEYKNLTSEEKELVLSYYDKEEDELTEQFYEDNFIICENCGEITYIDDVSDNDFLTWGGEMKICQDCINDGWGR